ncbi:MAG TPA: RNA polymerase-binding protein DksA [Ramlibacter sp.]|nr:RNA polymerase-binding protein DksA [Ramlibacter sp.]
MKAQSKAGKPAAKAKAKPAAKPSKPAAKAAKPVAKKASAKPAAKAPARKVAAKPAAKPAAKKPPVKAAKPAAKKPAPAPKAKPAAKAPATKPKTPAAKPAAKAKPAAGPAQPRAMPPRPDAATLGAEPARATKPSARLAQITVPSMAQSVASTAAKASYTQTMSPSVLTPPPLVAVKKDPKLANNWKTKTVEQLTDAEVMAMPDAEYMNDKQMAFFRLKLTQLKQDILNSAGETTEHLREDTVIVPDPADRATIEEEHALELRTRDRERKLLKKIEQSIARIDGGDYGYCDETGEPIGVGRLLARPTATLSLEAQQRRELKQKMFGD